MDQNNNAAAVPQTCKPNDPKEKAAFKLLHSLSGRGRHAQIEELVSLAKREVQEGGFTLSVLFACNSSKPSRIAASIEGLNPKSKEAETLRTIAVVGFLMGIRPFRQLSWALVSAGILQEHDIRRCAEPLFLVLGPQSRADILDNSSHIMDRMRVANCAGWEDMLRPPSRFSSPPPPPRGGDANDARAPRRKLP